MKTTLLFAVALLSTALPGQGANVDVPPGREVRDSKLLSPNLTDVWKVDAHAGEWFWCTVESAAFDPVLELFDADGKRLGHHDGEGTRSELWIRVDHAGPVQFRVAGFQGSGGGTYAFGLQRCRAEPLAAVGEASHRFGPEQWFHYRIALRAGDVLVPAIDGDGRIAALFDPEHRALAECLGGYTAVTDGEHVLRIEGGVDRACQLTTQLARRRTAPATPHIDDAVPARGLDVWTLPFAAGALRALEVTAPAAPLERELVDATRGGGAALAWVGSQDKGGTQRRWLFARRDGALELWLRNRAAIAVPYRAALSAATALLVPGGVHTASLALGDSDLHRLDLDGGQLVRLALHSAAFDARFDLIDPGGRVVAEVDDRSPVDRDAEHLLLVPRRGTYHVRVTSHGGGGAGAYELRADVLPVPTLATGGRLPFDLAPAATGHAHLLLQAGEEVWLSVRSTAFDAALTVLDPAGDGSFASEGGGRDGDVLVAYVARHTGVHTLLVHARNGQGNGELRAIAP